VKSGVPLDALDLTAIDPAYTDAMKSVFSLETALAARTNPGAPSVANVKREIDRWKACL
jgi:argininosuccinate lyase